MAILGVKQFSESRDTEGYGSRFKSWGTAGMLNVEDLGGGWPKLNHELF